MLSNESDGIPALIDPNICFLAQNLLLFVGYFCLTPFETQCLFLLRCSLPSNFLLDSTDKWLHENGEIVHSEIMIMSVNERC